MRTVIACDLVHYVCRTGKLKRKYLDNRDTEVIYQTEQTMGIIEYVKHEPDICDLVHYVCRTGKLKCKYLDHQHTKAILHTKKQF